MRVGLEGAPYNSVSGNDQLERNLFHHRPAGQCAEFVQAETGAKRDNRIARPEHGAEEGADQVFGAVADDDDLGGGAGCLGNRGAQPHIGRIGVARDRSRRAADRRDGVRRRAKRVFVAVKLGLAVQPIDRAEPIQCQTGIIVRQCGDFITDQVRS